MNQKITDLTALTGANTSPLDLFEIVDVSDLTMGAGGTNKKITREEFNTFNLGMITTDRKLINHSVTWNVAAVLTAWRLNVTDTLSNAGSLLLDMQVSGDSKVYATKAGAFWATNSINVGDSAASHFTLKSVGYLHWAERSGSFLWYNDSSSEGRHGANSLGIGTSQYSGMSVIFERDADDVLARRRLTNAQTNRLYRSFTDASNYQRLTQTWNTSTALIHNQGAGTGADGSIAFNDAVLTTDATKGFIMVPSCAGLATGVPADIPTGQIPIVYDSSNNKIGVYDGAWIWTATLS